MIKDINILDYCGEISRALDALDTIQRSMAILGLDRASDNLLEVIESIAIAENNIRCAYHEMIITERFKDAEDNSRALIETALSASAFTTD
jgi:hypothetical protein